MTNIVDTDTPTLIALRDKIEKETEALREEEERLRDEASDLDDEARAKERESEAIEKELRRREGLSWGPEISEAIADLRRRLHVRMLDGDWLSNGAFAWRVESVPAGWTPPVGGEEERGHLEAEMVAECYPIDLTAPVAEHEGSRPYSDFHTEAGRVRFDDRYWRAVASCGDRVAVTATRRCLVAFRDGQPTAIAMRMYNDGER
jgi:hypothetical protein